MQASGLAIGAALLVIGVIAGAGLAFGTYYATGSLTPRTTTGTTTKTLTTTVTTTLSSVQTAQVIGQSISLQVYSSLYQTLKAPYGTSGSAYLKYVQNYTGPLFYTKGEPILVYVGADYCPFCAIQRWPLVIALMRFGNFSNLEYMVSSEDNYATFTFSSSSYQSPYVVFQPYEVEDNLGNPLDTLPANYTTAFQQVGHSAFPFLNFADEYVISGAILYPTILGTNNWTQIISSIQVGDSSGSQVKQVANLMTAVICKTTGNNPASVCSQASITALADTPVSYTPPSTGSGSELLLAGASFTMSPDIRPGECSAHTASLPSVNSHAML